MGRCVLSSSMGSYHQFIIRLSHFTVGFCIVFLLAYKWYSLNTFRNYILLSLKYFINVLPSCFLRQLNSTLLHLQKLLDSPKGEDSITVTWINSLNAAVKVQTYALAGKVVLQNYLEVNKALVFKAVNWRRRKALFPQFPALVLECTWELRQPCWLWGWKAFLSITLHFFRSLN